MPFQASRCASLVLCGWVMIAAPSSARAESFKHQITGLFAPDREADLREALRDIPTIKIVRIDFATAEGTFEYDPKQAFPGAKPQQILEHFDSLVKNATHHTFGIKPLSQTPPEKLTPIEIAVVGLDCKACSLAAYEAIFKIDGVERATASFREGRVTALIDPTRTDRVALETALVNRGVTLKKSPNLKK